MIVYVESSAATKLMRQEAESEALGSFLEGLGARTQFVSSALLETELRRAAMRWGIEQEKATDVLSGIDLLAMRRGEFGQAGLLPPTQLRSLDALHLASALRADAELLISYDQRLLEAADDAGLVTVAPS